MRVLITGATGTVGPAVVDALLRGRYEVRVMSRQPTRSDVESIQGDIRDRAVVRRACEGVDEIVHLAAVLHHTRMTPELTAQYDAVNVGGTENVLDAARLCGVRRIVFGSTIAVYGRSGTSPIDESSVPQPDTDYARSKLESENKLLAQNAVEIVILRFGAIYGPRIKGNYERLVRSLAQHRFVPVGSGKNRRTILFDWDAAAAVQAVLTHPNAVTKVFNVAHPHTPTVAELIEVICRVLGRRSPRFTIPDSVVRLPVAVMNALLRPFHINPPPASAMLAKYLEDVSVSADKIRREIGFIAQYDLDAGWAATIREMRAAGIL